MLDAQGFLAAERLAVYEMVNALLTMELDLQAALDLRAEERQVFAAIAIATVQKFVRTAGPKSPHVGNAPLPRDLAGHISRRRVADALGLPLETTRRHVARLIERGLVVEVRRGQLQTPGGTLARLSENRATLRMARQFLSVIRAFERLGALGPRG